MMDYTILTRCVVLHFITKSTITSSFLSLQKIDTSFIPVDVCPRLLPSFDSICEQDSVIEQNVDVTESMSLAPDISVADTSTHKPDPNGDANLTTDEVVAKNLSPQHIGDISDSTQTQATSHNNIALSLSSFHSPVADVTAAINGMTTATVPKSPDSCCVCDPSAAYVREPELNTRAAMTMTLPEDADPSSSLKHDIIDSFL